MAKLKRLRIERFRGLVPGTELVFNDTFNVLLGQNGTGKTTLLKLIAMALASNFAALEGEDFALEYEIESVGVSLLVSIRNDLSERSTPEPRPARGRLPKHLAESSSPAWSYEARVRFHHATPTHRVSVTPLKSERFVDDTLVPDTEIPVSDPFQPGFLLWALQDVFYEAPMDLGPEWFDAMWDEILNPRGRGRFDEALRAFEEMTGESLAEESGDCIESPMLSILRTGVGDVSVKISPRIPPEITRLIESNPTLLEAKNPSLPHTELPFLRDAAELFQYSASDLILLLHSKKVTPAGEELLYAGLAFTFTLEDGSVITHDALSYGQKRLLSFFHYLAVSEDIVIADELVNGLHYDWIEACLGRLVDRQSFLTSQNPLLLDFLPFTSAEDVRRCFILCRRERHEGRRRTVWANMDEESANAFFRAYRTEALQVSEILRTKGLW
ncbi:AAA family ATPase [Sorangium sp. So ce1036]|uniref:AAA family ATPase n=1 Tax=Sorangium sp. So ce1036 TaxID=3133328 RepID=UPI003F046D9B